ncbi:MAG: segregation and condensation protein A [Gemmatimonadota bacterium]
MTSTATMPARGAVLDRVEPFVVELERFHGPLDLLLHLIRSQDIDIFDIPIACITEQFQAALAEGIERISLERAGEFLEMAATLVRIKAQLLLPRPEGFEWEEDPRTELVRRLLEYEHFQDIARVLTASEAERGRHFGKGYVEPRRAPMVLREALRLTLQEFLKVASRIPEPGPPEVHLAPVRTVTVEEKISLVQRFLREVKRLAFERLFAQWGTRAHAVASLLACLELARRQLLRIEQVKPFASIWLLHPKRRSRSSGEAP